MRFFRQVGCLSMCGFGTSRSQYTNLYINTYVPELRSAVHGFIYVGETTGTFGQ